MIQAATTYVDSGETWHFFSLTRLITIGDHFSRRFSQKQQSDTEANEPLGLYEICINHPYVSTSLDFWKV